MAEGDCQPAPKRIRIIREDLERMTKDELVQRWLEQEAYIEGVLSRNADSAAVAEAEEKFRQLQQESSRRENVLVMRLTAKEQELQEFVSQNEELKRAQNPSTAQLRGMLLDPAINLMFQRMKKEMEQSKEKLEQAQNDLAAWKFTPDGQTGKRLMAKCRALLQENEELGQLISAGRTAKLEGEIALGKKFVEEMKQSQAETDEFLVEMDEDVEGLQSTIYLLQQQLREAKVQISELQEQLVSNTNNRTNNGQASNRDPAISVKEEQMDSLAGEQRTSQNTGNISNCSIDSRDHKGAHSQTTNGGSHHTDMDMELRTASNANHDDSSEPMETGEANIRTTKVKIEPIQNGMVETEGTA